MVRPNDTVHILAKYTLSLPEDDGSETLVLITNEGVGRASREVMKGVFNAEDPSNFSNGQMGGAGDDTDGHGTDDSWYTRTCAKFEVRTGSKYEFLSKSLWVGVLKPPQKQGGVIVDMFQVG